MKMSADVAWESGTNFLLCMNDMSSRFLRGNAACSIAERQSMLSWRSSLVQLCTRDHANVTTHSELWE